MQITPLHQVSWMPERPQYLLFRKPERAIGIEDPVNNSLSDETQVRSQDLFGTRTPEANQALNLESLNNQ